MSDKIAAAAAEAGVEAPASTSVAPWPISEPYLAAFALLNRGRLYASGPAGPFPCGLAYTEVAAVARDAGFTHPWAFEEFVTLVYALDEEYLAYTAEKSTTG